MKILIVNTSDIQGGAARAAYRLHKSLLAQNIDSQMLVQNKSSDDYTVIGPDSNYKKAMVKLRSILDEIPLKKYKNRSKTYFSVSWVPFSGIVDQINAINPDIVHLHWINRGMIRIEELSKINAPIVWSMHDMWAFTGGCHYTEGCELYRTHCNNCKVLGSHKANELSNHIFKRKLEAYENMKNVTIVGLSSWMTDCANQSTLFKHTNIVQLPNPIDTKLFKPIEKEVARELWNFPQNRQLVLFGAMGATSDPRKGFLELKNALDFIEDEVEFVIFGSSQPKDIPDFTCKTHYVGFVKDEVSLCTLYNAVDVMVAPSLQENLSNAIMESLACGTPVVAFNIGGNGDMIEHEMNGYLAKPYDTQDLADGIKWVLETDEYSQLQQKARDKVLGTFDSNIVAAQYLELYRKVLN